MIQLMEQYGILKNYIVQINNSKYRGSIMKDKSNEEKVKVKEEKDKINKIILTILLILVILVIAIGIVYGGRIINKVKLDRELGNLADKETSSESNITLVTSGEFGVVEQKIKEYYDEYLDLRKGFMDKVNDEKLEEILKTENYNEDGPEFTESVNYLNTSKEEFNNIAENLLDLLSKENIVSRIENESIGDYYKDLYKGYFLEGDRLADTFEESYQDIKDVQSLMNNLYDNEIKILNFLTENAEHWEVLDDKLTFNDDALSEEYNNMKENLYSEQ